MNIYIIYRGIQIYNGLFYKVLVCCGLKVCHVSKDCHCINASACIFKLHYSLSTCCFSRILTKLYRPIIFRQTPPTYSTIFIDIKIIILYGFSILMSFWVGNEINSCTSLRLQIDNSFNNSLHGTFSINIISWHILPNIKPIVKRPIHAYIYRVILLVIPCKLTLKVEHMFMMHRYCCVQNLVKFWPRKTMRILC